jgi:WbqC-like protein family
MRQVGKINIEIIDLQYFGSIELYSTLKSGKDVYFSPESNYDKALHSNRTVINGANGLIALSIPLQGGRNQKRLFKDVQIAEHENWRRIHWRSIHSSYRKSPWFEELGWRVEQLYSEPVKYLSEWNLKSMRLMLELLRLKLDILAHPTSSDCKPAFIDNNRSPMVKPPEDYPVYQQVFMERFGFSGNLSILDLLFCMGPYAIQYLQLLANYKNAQ